jgi:hypothetical protein
MKFRKPTLLSDYCVRPLRSMRPNNRTQKRRQRRVRQFLRRALIRWAGCAQRAQRLPRWGGSDCPCGSDACRYGHALATVAGAIGIRVPRSAKAMALRDDEAFCRNRVARKAIGEIEKGRSM